MFKERAAQLVDNGWPVIPLAGKRPVIAKWQTFADRFPFQSEIAYWSHMWPKGNIGTPLGGMNNTLAIDFDILDPEVSYAITEVARSILPPTEFIRIGESPKQVWLYRSEEPSATLHYDALDILGIGSQVVLYGIHPKTGRYYSWPSEEPFYCSPEDLPLVTALELGEFLKQACPSIAKRQHVNGKKEVVPLHMFDELRNRRHGRHGASLYDALAGQLRDAVPGTFHNTMVSVISTMASRGLSAGKIRFFVDFHFSAPRGGDYAPVWGQIDGAISSAIGKYGSTA